MLRLIRGRGQSRGGRMAGVGVMALLGAVAGGCGGSPALSILGPAKAPIGEGSLYTAARGTTCSGKVFGGPSDPTGGGCPPDHLLTAADATCDDGACVVEDIAAPDQYGVIKMKIVGSRPGPAVLRVHARVDDGSDMSNTLNVSFVTATGLNVRCDAILVGEGSMLVPSGQCGGHYPVFADSSWKWDVTFNSAEGSLEVQDLAITVRGGDSVVGTFEGGQVTLSAAAAAAQVEVDIASRQFTKTIPLRVATLGEVVGVELALVPSAGDGLEADIPTLGPPPDTLWYLDRTGRRFAGDTNGVTVRPLLTLQDGSHVHGGAGLFSSNQPKVCNVFGPRGGGTAMQQTWLQLQVLGTGTATLSASIAGIPVTWPVTVVRAPGP